MLQCRFQHSLAVHAFGYFDFLYCLQCFRSGSQAQSAPVPHPGRHPVRLPAVPPQPPDFLPASARTLPAGRICLLIPESASARSSFRCPVFWQLPDIFREDGKAQIVCSKRGQHRKRRFWSDAAYADQHTVYFKIFAGQKAE